MRLWVVAFLISHTLTSAATVKPFASKRVDHEPIQIVLEEEDHVSLHDLTRFVFNSIFLQDVKSVVSEKQGKRGTCPALPKFMNSDRIVGGKAAPSPIPWQVSIRSCNAFSCRHFCGGTILDSQTILTAAHCQVSTRHFIMAGQTNTKRGKNVGIANVITHRDYDEDTSDNDIAIIKLSSPLTFGDDVQAICLPDRYYFNRISTPLFFPSDSFVSVISILLSMPHALSLVGEALLSKLPIYLQASIMSVFQSFLKLIAIKLTAMASLTT